MTFALFLDMVIAILLVVTISYALTLNKRLAALRKDREVLEKLATTFTGALQRAGDSTVNLKRTAEEMSDRIKRAEQLRDDLQFLIERGGQIADRIEDGVRAARSDATSQPQSQPRPRVAAAGGGGGLGAVATAGAPAPARARAKVVSARTQAERDLLRVLQSVR